jgi:phosphoribosylglycinamide formyltransferase-1
MCSGNGTNFENILRTCTKHEVVVMIHNKKKNPDAFPAPIINVHPSLLPKYKGLYAIEQAMESGDKETGCTVHYVNEELDGGEIILQGKVPILPDDDIVSLTKAIQRQEYAILPAAIEHVKNSLPTKLLDYVKH